MVYVTARIFLAVVTVLNLHDDYIDIQQKAYGVADDDRIRVDENSINKP